MKKIIVKHTLYVLLCCFSIGTGFSQMVTSPPVDCNGYDPNQLIIQIDKTPPSGNNVTGTTAFTSLGGVAVGSITESSGNNLYLVAFDFRSPRRHFNNIEEAHDFYECGEGIIESVSGIKRVKVRGSDFNYQLSVNTSDSPTVGYNLQNYTPYGNCQEPYIGLPSIASCNSLTIATIDSGCEQGTPFDNQVLFDEGYDFVENDLLAYDENGHGTKVLSVVAGETYNNASDINYIPVRVLDEHGEGDLWTFFKGLDFAIAQAELIIISLEAIMCEDDLCTNVYESLLFQARDKNRLIVAAAGNTGLLIDPGHNYCIPGSGRGDNLIVVGGSSCFQGPAGFTNYGPLNVDISAPSENILVYPSALATGTSFAAPQIASVAAIAALTSPKFKPLNIKHFILDNFIDRNWTNHSVTGGTFDYTTLFNVCPGNTRSEEADEDLILPDFSMHTYFSENNLTLSINSPTEHSANVQIVYLSGAVLAEQPILLTPGSNEHQINTTQLPLGVYLVSVSLDNGRYLWKKVIKSN